MVKPIEKPIYTTKEERLKAIKRLAQSTNKDAGMECVTMADDLKTAPRAYFGIPDLDKYINGLPYGNFYTFWGAPKAGKSTLALYLAASAQKAGKIVAWIALEPFDKERAVQFGINLEEMPVIQCPKAEGSLDILIEYARNKLVDVVVLDSIHSLAPKKMMEKKSGEIKGLETDTMGVLASKLSEFFKIAIDPVKRSEMLVFLIGQTRKGLGGIVVLDILTGGNALIHNSRLIGHVRRGAKDDAPIRISYEETDEKDAKGKPKKKKIETIIGFNCVIKLDAVQISGCSPEQTVINIPYYFESGFDLPPDLKALADAEEKEIASSMNKDAKTGVNDERMEIGASSPSTEAIKPIKIRGRPKKIKVNNEQ